MKKTLIILVIVILAVSAGIYYLNKEVLPIRIRAAIVSGLEEATGKKVLLGSVHFNIFKGLVLNDLIIRDELNAIINVKEVRCRFLIIPLFNKKMIISSLVFEAPDIFIERRADSSLNILELFPKAHTSKSGFNTLLHGISVRKAVVTFHDLTLDPVMTKEIKGLDAEIYFLLPSNIKYEATFQVPSDQPTKIELSGNYSIPEKELTAEITVEGLALKEFAGYYKKTGLTFSEGTIDSSINLKYKNDILTADTRSEIKALAVSADKMALKVSGTINSDLGYNFTDKKFSYTGVADIRDMSIRGIGVIDKIDRIKGKIGFSNLGLSSENITAVILDVPVDASISISDLNDAVLELDISADIELSSFQEILKERFDFAMPADLDGTAELTLAIQYKFSSPDQLQLKGSVDTDDITVKLNNGKEALTGVTGIFEFTPNQVKWDGAEFRYRDTAYTASGTLTNFKAPGIQLKLASEDIALNTVFAVNGKLLNFSKLSGKYLNSEFSLSGALDSSDPGKLNADISGVITVDLADLRKPLAKFKENMDSVKPEGAVRAEFSLDGDLKDLKRCAIDANLSSNELSLYGFRLANSTINYSQKGGVGDVLFMRSFLYGGSMNATGRIGWDQKDTPYRLEAAIDGVRIEKLKVDTAFKDKDIAGLIRMGVKLNGLFNDIGRLTGEGRISVTEGNLWQLNLFRGLGVILFSSDFSNVIFRDAYCGFTIRDKEAFTDLLTLKSDLVHISGPLRIGFDRSVDATLKAAFTDEAMEPGTMQNLVTALGKYSLIRLTGTLKEPQYKVQPDVSGIVESIAERLFEQ